MDERLISIIRRPQVLVTLVGRRRVPFSLESSHPEPYVEVPIAMSRVLERTCPWRDKDDKAWRALGNVPRMTDRAALALIRIIIGSVADPEQRPTDLPTIDPAAVPRDLRPHLCHPEHEQQILDSMSDALAAASGDTDMPEWHWSKRRELGALPPDFLRLFVWSLHLSPWPRMLEMLAAFEALELGQPAKAGLRSAMARLLSLAGGERALAWAGLLLSLPAERRVRAAELVIESGAHAREPTDGDQQALGSADDREAWRALSS
jgi:hypothetical protein